MDVVCCVVVVVVCVCVDSLDVLVRFFYIYIYIVGVVFHGVFSLCVSVVVECVLFWV